jgi:putative transposase
MQLFQPRRFIIPSNKAITMPKGLRRFQQTRQMHFITFSCYRRQPKLSTVRARNILEHSLEKTRRVYRFCVAGYVVMPEHVHLLLTEPESSPLATALQALKQSVSRTLSLRAPEPFWQARYFDFNVWSEAKRIEKLRYLHRNPVARGLVEKPQDWPWSSFRHYATGFEGVVEIESEWTARKRESMGIRLKVRAGPVSHFPPKQSLDGAPEM